MEKEFFSSFLEETIERRNRFAFGGKRLNLPFLDALLSKYRAQPKSKLHFEQTPNDVTRLLAPTAQLAHAKRV
jgi:hypothetical protein